MITPVDLASQLDQALQTPGTLHLDHPEVSIEAEIEAIDTLGVRLRSLRLRPQRPGPMEESAKKISDHLRPNGERLDLVELDPILGGARLRTTRTDIRNHRYFQINIDSVGQVDLQRIQADPQSGHRAGTHFDLSREALGRLAEDLLDACQAADEP